VLRDPQGLPREHPLAVKKQHGTVAARGDGLIAAGRDDELRITRDPHQRMLTIRDHHGHPRAGPTKVLRGARGALAALTEAVAASVLAPRLRVQRPAPRARGRSPRGPEAHGTGAARAAHRDAALLARDRRRVPGPGDLDQDG